MPINNFYVSPLNKDFIVLDVKYGEKNTHAENRFQRVQIVQNKLCSVLFLFYRQQTVEKPCYVHLLTVQHYQEKKLANIELLMK